MLLNTYTSAHTCRFGLVGVNVSLSNQWTFVKQREEKTTELEACSHGVKEEKISPDGL